MIMLKQVAVIALLLPSTFPAFMKNQYEVDVENVLACPNNERARNPIRNLKFFHYNRTHKALNLDFTYDKPLDEKIGGSIVVERWGDGGWIKIPFVGFQANICQHMLRFFKKVWVYVNTKAGVARPDHCPVPAGNYSLRNYILDTTTVSNVPFWSGRFRFTVMYEDDDTKDIFLCIMYIFKITETF